MIMPKKIYKEAPPHYPICLHADCPRAGHCLHRVAYGELIGKCEMLSVINPERCRKDGDECPYFRDAAPVAYARGFTGMQRRMYPDQYKRFMRLLTEHFGRNPYFERRKGETVLSPSEQQIVLDALRKAGVTEDLKFDAYEENINWND